ncbi:MAG: type IV pilus modification PilV family protein [Candidatus Xenobia bacterium]
MRRGFTLLEVVVSMGVLAIAITVGMSAFDTLLRGSQGTVDNTTAVAVAETLLTEEVNQMMTAPDSVFNQPAANLPAPPSGTAVIDGVTYTYSTTLQDVAMDLGSPGAITFHNAATDNPATGTRLKRIDTAVSWTPPGQQGPHQIAVTRMLWVNQRQ